MPLAAGMATTLRTSVKNSVQNLIDYTTYLYILHITSAKEEAATDEETYT